jgi:hypothetical protein
MSMFRQASHMDNMLILIPKSRMGNLRHDLTSDQRGTKERSAGNKLEHEDQAEYGSMDSMPHSEIAASLRIFVCPGRKQQFAKFTQKLKF